MTNKKRIRNRINTGLICPNCQGPKDGRAATCKTCLDDKRTHYALCIRTCINCQSEFTKEQGLYLRCRPCKNLMQSEDIAAEDTETKRLKAERTKQWRENNPEKIRRRNVIRKCKYIGLIDRAEEIGQLCLTQKNCPICKRHTDECGVLHIDHDHTTGEFRGLICGNCNVMLGHAKDNTVTLQTAIEYLIKSRS